MEYLPYIALAISIFVFWFTVIRPRKQKDEVRELSDHVAKREPTKEQLEMMSELMNNPPECISIAGWSFTKDGDIDTVISTRSADGEHVFKMDSNGIRLGEN